MNLLGLSKDLGLQGTQYSLVSSVIPFAQMAWQPFSSYLVVRVDTRVLMTALIVLWGTMETVLCAANSYAAIMAIRFFLGLFEAGCLPLFSILTAQWYRR
jgi:MFS family permease